MWQVGASYDAKPYRRTLIETFGGTVHRSPSRLTSAGRAFPADHPGSLGIAISEAVEVAAAEPDTKYALGSVLNHVLLHQTIIGEEALLQLAMAGESGADLVVGCTGGGSNFGGLAFPFIREKLAGRQSPVIRAVEPASCPSLTRGEYRYDFGDTAGFTPLMKMHTLGHDFVPDPIHAGGLRYHGMAPLISHIYELGLMEAIAIEQTECFAAAITFARTEGIVPAPEPTHALAATIREALAVQGVRRGEGDRHRAVRARPARPAGLRRLPARHDGRLGLSDAELAAAAGRGAGAGMIAGAGQVCLSVTHGLAGGMTENSAAATPTCGSTRRTTRASRSRPARARRPSSPAISTHYRLTLRDEVRGPGRRAAGPPLGAAVDDVAARPGPSPGRASSTPGSAGCWAASPTCPGCTSRRTTATSTSTAPSPTPPWSPRRGRPGGREVAFAEACVDGPDRSRRDAVGTTTARTSRCATSSCT